MSRLQFSINAAPSPQRQTRYEDRLSRIAGGGAVSAERPTSTPFLTQLLKIAGALAIVAALAVALAIWRIYHFPH
ncbi:hypothetical protein [Methylocystis echinoides]|uniref:Uncharacterized protein n=1 Tax=Methylocystis echinoides TaxID=29468 RepID=A0A9W6GWX6_9HYPH|nr:hypothetical protein [Methylocystis echinoides]GLI94320.1 hypothetical protein LMG27198_33120 [Methylocystis echinoides]